MLEKYFLVCDAYFRLSFFLISTLCVGLAAMAWQYPDNWSVRDVRVQCSGTGLQIKFYGVVVEMVWCKGQFAVSLKYFGDGDGDRNV